jgi:predicted ribosome quality control (RQC) complex YloA/Tae2 family protein
MEKRKSFSNVDVLAITRELDIILSNTTIANIYETEDLLILKINTNEGRKDLIIKSDSRINLTNFNYPIPKYPSQYIMSLRKFLKNKRILHVSQHNFDRIIVMELFNAGEEPWKFIIELFDKGNFLLIDGNNHIKIAKRYKKFKDRDLLAGKEYVFPLSRGEDFLTITKKAFLELIKNSDTEVVRNIARNINIAGLYSEEICYGADIEKTKFGVNLNEDELKILFKSFKNLRNQMLFGNINAHIIINNAGEELAVLPFELKMFGNFKFRSFGSYNEAVDEYFSKIDSEIIKTPSDEKIKKKIKAQEKILKNQKEYLDELRIKKEKYYKLGDFIYTHFKPLENLLNTILNAKSKGYKWEEINDKLNLAKLENINGSELFSKIIPSTKQIIIKIGEDEVYLDINKSIGENANIIYEKGKKAEKKIKGTIPAIDKTVENIQNLLIEKESIEAEVNFLIKKPKKKWFEKFRWFISSDDFLVIGGRDASSNESIFKKYIDPNDLVFHTNFQGSPLVVIKNPENKGISELTIKETADFVASYSSAWKEAWGVVDVFYIKPSQVSKSPPSGEYLPKGSFIISGKKSFIKNAKTELAIGIELVDIEVNQDLNSAIYYPKILCGPQSAIKLQTNKFIIIKPSKTGFTKGALAKEIKRFYLNTMEKDIRKWINLLSIDDIILNLPTGLSTIHSKS